MSFAAELKAARERLGLTQAEAASLLGVSFEAVSKWERGLSTPAEITQEGARARLSAAGRAAGAGGVRKKRRAAHAEGEAAKAAKAKPQA